MIAAESPVAAPQPVLTESPALAKPPRLICLDAYRGLVMLLMASNGLGIAYLAAQHPSSSLWQFLGYQAEHAPWRGCALWDMIQPSFMFIAGASIPFSYAGRRACGQSGLRTVAHVLWRSLLLIALGIFLRSVGAKQTYYTFEDVLTQIGLGYALVYLLVGCGPRLQLLAAAAILAGYWYAFYHYPAPPPGFDYHSVGLPADVAPFTGLAAHWNKNTNFAANFDVWFMNLFPRSKPFAFNGGGYLTLNFIPSMATMIFGMMTGSLLRSPLVPAAKLKRLAFAGLIALAIGVAMDPSILPGVHLEWSLCPIVKRIWTPSWAIFAAGWTLLILAALFWLIEMRRWQRWVFPLIVVGMNSMAMYLMAHLLHRWILQSLQTHLGQGIFSGTFGPMLSSAAVLAILWLVCLWMYRRRIFLRI